MYAIETKNLTKRFGDFIANDDINLAIPKGKIVAIIGENGAGKSTLMNMLYGMLEPSDGEILVSGEKVQFHSPKDAIAKNIGMVHQHFKLVPSLTVYENILLGVEIRKKIFNISIPILDPKSQIEIIQKLIDQYQFDLNPTDIVAEISVGAQQRIEILKMLYRDAEILIFDEPTAVLTPQEVDQLFINLKELQRQGKTIVMITHKLKEVKEISDYCIVIRRGKVVAELETCEISEEDLAAHMVGRHVKLTVEKTDCDVDACKPAFIIDNLSTYNNYGKKVLHDISLCIHAGEIVGIAGIEGNGQSELVQVLTGMMKSTSGTVYLQEKEITNAWPSALRENGLGIIPEDRYAQGLCSDMTISQNMIAGYMNQGGICKYGILQKKAIKEQSDELIQEYDIRVSSDDIKVSGLSGGNAQKIIIARELSKNPIALLACQPTRGVDIGSIEFIHRQIVQLRDQGAAILLISSDLNEIMNLSDTIVVMYKGKTVLTTKRADILPEELGLYMAGSKQQKVG